MHYYLYDKYLSDKKYEGTLTRIEHRLIELGVNGHIERMSVLKSIPRLISESIERGANTIVVAGSDETLLEVIEIIGKFGNAVLGFIPMSEDSRLAKIFGIPPFEGACDVLSRRIIESVDLGVVNSKHFFLGSLDMPAKAELEFKGPYRVKTKSSDHHLAITNLGRIFSDEEPFLSIGTDGLLEAIVVKTEKRGLFKRSYTPMKESVIPFEKTRVVSADDNGLQAIADNKRTFETPFTVKIAKGALKMIVGKGRQISGPDA